MLGIWIKWLYKQVVRAESREIVLIMKAINIQQWFLVKDANNHVCIV